MQGQKDWILDLRIIKIYRLPLDLSQGVSPSLRSYRENHDELVMVFWEENEYSNSSLYYCL